MLLLSSSFLSFAVAYQPVFAAVYLCLVIPVLAWPLVAYAGLFPSALLAQPTRTATDWLPKNIAPNLAKFLWVVVFAGLTAILSVVAVCNLLPLNPVDRMALMTIVGPLLWGAVSAWMLMQYQSWRLRLLLAAVGLSAVAALIR